MARGYSQRWSGLNGLRSYIAQPGARERIYRGKAMYSNQRSVDESVVGSPHACCQEGLSASCALADDLLHHR